MAINKRTENEARRNLQTYLRQLSYFDPGIPPVPIDGLRGDDTTDALISYQLSRGFEPTGIADIETWEAVYEDYLISLEENSSPARMSVFPTNARNIELKRGDSGFVVSAIQYLLSELSLMLPTEELSISGFYDDGTSLAIEAFQTLVALPVTGNTDKLTWDALVRLFDSVHLYQ